MSVSLVAGEVVVVVAVVVVVVVKSQGERESPHTVAQGD